MMPKIKTHKATSKRFKYSGSGKLMRTKIGKSHLRRKKSARVKAMFDEMHVVTDDAARKRIRKLAPYLDK
jgi:large subunit ribosomal protein L35